MKLIWEGELDLGSRAAALRSLPPPPGVSISHSLIEISTRSWWALVSWAVSGVMLWFGLTADNWVLLALSPFMVTAAIMQSLGRISILVQDEQLTIFEGVAGIGRRRKIPLRAIQSVEYAAKHGRGGSTAWIVIHQEGRALKFGRHVNEEQRHFVIGFLLREC